MPHMVSQGSRELNLPVTPVIARLGGGAGEQPYAYAFGIDSAILAMRRISPDASAYGAPFFWEPDAGTETGQDGLPAQRKNRGEIWREEQ